MIKIYLWKQREANVGHLSLELSDKTYISFWPAENLELKRKKRSGSNTYDDDVESEGREADDILELPDDIVDQEKITSWWSGYKDKNKYHLLINNCALVVQQALLVGEIYQTDYLIEGGTNRFGPMITPAEIFQWATECKALYPIKENNSLAAQMFRGIRNYFKS